MAAKNSRNWNDVQTAIATAAIVTTIGLWNLFATPKIKVVQANEPVIPPTEPPVEPTSASAASVPTAMPQVKIMFAPGAATQTSVVPQPQISNPQPQVQIIKKKRNSGGGGTVTVTKTS